MNFIAVLSSTLANLPTDHTGQVCPKGYRRRRKELKKGTLSAPIYASCPKLGKTGRKNTTFSRESFRIKAQNTAKLGKNAKRTNLTNFMYITPPPFPGKRVGPRWPPFTFLCLGHLFMGFSATRTPKFTRSSLCSLFTVFAHSEWY